MYIDARAEVVAGESSTFITWDVGNEHFWNHH